MILAIFVANPKGHRESSESIKFEEIYAADAERGKLCGSEL